MGLSADIFLEQPKRALREAKAAAAAAPTIDVAESATNPSFLPMKLGPIFPRGLSGVTCNKGTETLSPVAQLVVRAERRVDVSADRGLRLVNDKGDCQSNLKDRTLAAGRYTLWAKAETKAGGGAGGPSGSSGGGDVVGTAFELSIEDEGRVLSFADAPILDAGTLEAPAVVTAKTVDGPAWVGGLGRCSTLTRAPSFYVRGDADNVEVSLWRSPALTNVRFEVVGPLEAQISEDEERRRRTNKSSDDDDDEFDGPRFAYRCDQMGGDTTFRRLKGTYAVFVRAEERGADITLLARRLDRTPDLLTAPIAIPESMPMAERALPRHYPLLQFVRRSTDINGTFPPENLEAFFLDAPRGLFVSVADVPAGTSLVAGEPLLIRGWSKRQARVSRADGTSVDIPTASLVELPATVTLPKKAPKPEVAKDLEGALRLAGPGEKELLESYFVAERKHNACVGAWMKKNDPTWGKSLSWSTSTAARP